VEHDGAGVGVVPELGQRRVTGRAHWGAETTRRPGGRQHRSERGVHPRPPPDRVLPLHDPPSGSLVARHATFRTIPATCRRPRSFRRRRDLSPSVLVAVHACRRPRLSPSGLSSRPASPPSGVIDSCRHRGRDVARQSTVARAVLGALLVISTIARLDPVVPCSGRPQMDTLPTATGDDFCRRLE
jgi:hypothetical protein